MAHHELEAFFGEHAANSKLAFKRDRMSAVDAHYWRTIRNALAADTVHLSHFGLKHYAADAAILVTCTRRFLAI